MDRRQFGKLALSAGAATTAAGEAGLALAQTSSVSPSDALKLPAELRPVFEQDYPRFSDAEYSRRRDLLAGVMEAAGVDHLLIVSALNVGNATRWVTGWPGTNQALLLFRPGEKMVMYVEYHNHVPQARLIARDVDVRWGEDKGIATVIDELGRRGSKRVGVMGPLFGPRWKALEAKFQVVSLDGEYTRLRINNKSEEEIAWLRVGAALSDAGMAALVGGTKPGMTEHEIGNMIERAYVGLGGTNVIHFLGTTPMAAPDVCVPRQFTSRRKVRPATSCSASSPPHGGTIPARCCAGSRSKPSPRRSIAICTPPRSRPSTPSPRRSARACMCRSSSTRPAVIEKNGFTTNDDLVHGYGGGYFAPILGSKSRPAGHPVTMTLQENMCMVVQPNPVTKDGKAGVQFGELVRVTKTGFESLHRTPHELFRAGQMI